MVVPTSLLGGVLPLQKASTVVHGDEIGRSRSKHSRTLVVLGDAFV